jgi:glycosyltransferase involved in cell wall biosynthesis
MKILHVTPFYPPNKGGISNLAFFITSNLMILGTDIKIITSRSFNERCYEKNSEHVTRIVSFYFPGWPFPTLKSFSIPFDLGYRINSLMDKERFDLVHVHGHHYPICWMALKSAHKKKIPTILSVHGMYALNPKKLGGYSMLEELFNLIIFRRILSDTDVVIGGTTQIVNYAKKYGSPLTLYKTIPNGVNVKSFSDNLHKKAEFRRKYSVNKNKIVILFVGRFEEVKGILQLADAAKKLSKQFPGVFDIVMAGGGKEENKIKSELNDYSDIHIIPWVSYSIIHELYIAADIFILPSKFEALPLTIIEAMNAHLHIVYSPVGGVEEILGGYSKKSKLPEVSSDAIFCAIQTIVRSNLIFDDAKESLSYAQKFDWRLIALEINDLYMEILSQSR